MRTRIYQVWANVILIIGCCWTAEAQSMLSFWGIELNDQAQLLHMSGDAFQLLVGGEEAVYIDPEWSDERLAAYSVQSNAILLKVNTKSVGAAAPGNAYYVVRLADQSTRGPLSEADFQNALAALAVPAADVKWIEPVNPRPYRKWPILALFAIALTGHILPIPFALVWVHYKVLKKRLHALEMAHGEAESGGDEDEPLQPSS